MYHIIMALLSYCMYLYTFQPLKAASVIHAMPADIVANRGASFDIWGGIICQQRQVGKPCIPNDRVFQIKKGYLLPGTNYRNETHIQPTNYDLAKLLNYPPPLGATQHAKKKKSTMKKTGSY